MPLVVESYPADQAAAVGRAHLQLNPGHHVQIAACECGQPVGILCKTCVEVLCAVDLPESGHE